MDRQATPRSELECMIFDGSTKPKALPLSLLQDITSDFSIDQVIGSGGFAMVYKGVLGNGIVAVKRLTEKFGIDEEKFSGEIQCLMKAKHKNIVRLLGYCSNAQGEMLDYEGKLVLAEERERLLCFEYLPEGSLDKKITDASCGLAWRERYQIIVGICDGLYYLHQRGIVHLDLKPGNILLDDYMVPKIADFGLSRFFDEKQSQAIASKVMGTMGYCAPEFSSSRKITFKSDIYSLGVMIMEILTGEKGYADIDNVLESWRNSLGRSQVDTQLVQVRTCTEIAIECTDFNPAKRPDVQDIINRLGATKSVDEFATETGASSSSTTQLAAVPLGPTTGPENATMPVSASNVQQITDIRETTLDSEEAPIIGRNEETQKIVATLSGSITPDFSVHPIYGFGDRRLSLVDKRTDGIAEKHEVDNSEINTHFIEQISKIFSEEQKIGSGGYGEVYKAVYNGEASAVKKLYNMQAIDDKEFTNEFSKLMKVKHRNIVQLIGYCHGIQDRFVKINGKLLSAKTIDRLLCSEYMEDGSLANHLSDESCGFDWPTQYRIIKGICDGLNHLHNEQNDFIYHLNLSPNNIFLDKNMMPRIADFGMYRLLASSKTHISQIVKGTLGYMPPEFIDKCRITEKYDVFSVGVIIIQIMAGTKGYKNCCEMSSPQFIELVQENWKNRLQQIPMQENAYTTNILAVQRCIELAVRCVDAEPVKRPSIMEVVYELGKLDADIEKILHQGQEAFGSRYLTADPASELRFIFEPNKDTSCCMQLINKTEEFIAFNIKSNIMMYKARPNRGTMPPMSRCYVMITRQAQQKEPPYMRQCDMIVVRSTRIDMESGDEITDEFFEKAAASMAVDVVRLPIVLVTLVD